jgi:hypothetical protein
MAAECAYVDERGGVGIRLEPAAAIVRQYGDQFRREAPRKRSPSRTPEAYTALVRGVGLPVFFPPLLFRPVKPAS